MDSERDLIQNRYQAGIILAPIGQASRDYGPAPIPNIAKAFAVSVCLIRNCILVASTLSREDLNQLMTAARTKGFILAWGHLVELCKVDSTIRAELVRDMFNNRMRVFELARARRTRTFSAGDGALTDQAANEWTEQQELRKLEALWIRVRARPNFRPLEACIEEIRDNVSGS